MALRTPHRLVVALRVVALAVALVLLPRAGGAQQFELDARTTFFHEPAPKSTMTVYTPSADLSVKPWDFLKVSGGWEADIVSGASERIKAGGAYGARFGPDIVTSASVHDVRNVGRGSVTVIRELTQLSAGYTASKENDYKSQSFNVGARTDLLEHDTQLEISYARNWDQVCDLAHTAGVDPTLRQPLDSSKGCFQPSAPDRTEQPIRTDGFQASWSQAWTPVLATQLLYTGQVQHGFLSDPYRAVVLSFGGQYAQEHHPDDRARQALALRSAYFLRPLKSAVRLGLRAYRDTWGIQSGTVELEAERYMLPWLRLRARGRYYRQNGALFWSDDYSGGEGPKGQYFSGDRELSPFSSWLLGLRLLGAWTPQERRFLGIFRELQAAIAGDVLLYDYRDFTLAGLPVQDTRAYVGSVSVTAFF